MPYYQVRIVATKGYLAVVEAPDAEVAADAVTDHLDLTQVCTGGHGGVQVLDAAEWLVEGREDGVVVIQEVEEDEIAQLAL